MFNPFTLGIAQRLADVPIFSGLQLRLPLFLVTTAMVIYYILRYVRKLERDPDTSITRETDLRLKTILNPEARTAEIKNIRTVTLFILFLLIAVRINYI